MANGTNAHSPRGRASRSLQSLKLLWTRKERDCVQSSERSFDCQTRTFWSVSERDICFNFSAAPLTTFLNKWLRGWGIWPSVWLHIWRAIWTGDVSNWSVHNWLTCQSTAAAWLSWFNLWPNSREMASRTVTAVPTKIQNYRLILSPVKNKIYWSKHGTETKRLW